LGGERARGASFAQVLEDVDEIDRGAGIATTLSMDVETDVAGQAGEPGLEVLDLPRVVRQAIARHEHRAAYRIGGVGVHAAQVAQADAVEMIAVVLPDRPEGG